MTDFEQFIIANKLKKKDIATYMGVSAAFVTQLISGLRQVPSDKLALIKANDDWDTSMFSQAACGAPSDLAGLEGRMPELLSVLMDNCRLWQQQVEAYRTENDRLLRIIEAMEKNHAEALTLIRKTA